ncbi:MAG: FRG domain-containing protein [Pseudomonadota bacterium]
MTITKLSEYMAYVEELPDEFYLSRGQSKDYSLLPKALRLDEAGNRKYSKRVIRGFLDQFKIDSYQYMENPWDIKNDIEWMLYAQHYGIPTKLMDFTTSHIISLLFAVENSFQDESEDDSIVYFLNPTALNNKIKLQSQIINISDDSKISSEGHDGPFVVQGRKLNSRINAQKGLFVLFQDDDSALNKGLDDLFLRKLKINGEYKKNILASLYSMGISFTHIYPELTSVAKDIIMQQDIADFTREDG